MFSPSWLSKRRRAGGRSSSIPRVLLLVIATALALATLLLSFLYLTHSAASEDSSAIDSPFVNGPPLSPLHRPSLSTPPLPTPPLPFPPSPSPATSPTLSLPPSLTPAETECSRRLGSGLLHRWSSASAVYIEPSAPPLNISLPSSPSPSSSISLHPGFLTCASMTIPDMPPPTAPHSSCTASHLYLFLSSLSSAQAPKHRAGYAFGTMQHYHYAADAMQLVGTRTQEHDLSRICGDHMRDSVEAVHPDATGADLYTRLSRLQPSQRLALCDDCTLLLVTREGGEHVNLFHTLTDWFNAFLMLHKAQLTSPAALAKVRVLFLDNHPSGYLDPLWQAVFTPSYPLLRVANLTAQGVDAIYTPRAMWVPAGYSSPIWVHLRDGDPCHDQVDLVALFAAFVKMQLHLVDTPLTLPLLAQQYPHATNMSQSTAAYAAGVISQHTLPFAPPSPVPSLLFPPRVLHVVLISRRPYRTATVDHSHMNRRILNEPDLVDGLLSIPLTFHPAYFTHLHLTFVDFARIHIQHQLTLVSTADLLIGVHGAALSHATFLPAKGALLELQPQAQNWRIFQHLQQWSHRQGVEEGQGGREGKSVRDGEGDWRLDDVHGTNYGEWRNTVPSRERRDEIGDGVEVDVQQVKGEVIRLLSWRDRRESQPEGAT